MPGPEIAARRRFFEQLMFGSGRVRRFTQDSPVLPDVWLAYAGCVEEADGIVGRGRGHLPRLRLLLTPWRDADVGTVRSELVRRLDDDAHRRKDADWRAPRVVYNQTTVAAELDLAELVRGVLPMTEWWSRVAKAFTMSRYAEEESRLALAIEDPEHPLWPLGSHGERSRLAPELLWTLRVVGALALLDRDGDGAWDRLPTPAPRTDSDGREPDPGWLRIVQAVGVLIRDLASSSSTPRVHSVSRNRDVAPALNRSRLAIKADAACQLFDIRCDKITWAILDSGIDARHPAFRSRVGRELVPGPFSSPANGPGYQSRVIATYDFTAIDRLLDPDAPDDPDLRARRAAAFESQAELQDQAAEMRQAIQRGRAIDWRSLESLISIRHTAEAYVPPASDHGTHVAGILAGEWRKGESDGVLQDDLVGICRDLRLIDLRVLDGEGRGSEFALMAALQFVRYLNAAHDYVRVHGINLSLSIPHDVANYACGRTPICDEAERVVAAGIVVVAAAGNQGYRRYATVDGYAADAYNSSSITDPGNAEAVITVGATHRYRPHTYGVSYFSSRGPTGDGRAKPDLVAPGEKIEAPLPDGLFGVKDGTSMAAPHVSGAAALLLARHGELVGRPARIKELLCRTATDLGRERYFQGAGMLDVLRALQAV